MAKLPTESEIQLAFDELIDMLPQNALNKYETQIEQAIQNGLTYKQVALIFNEKFNIKVKSKDVKAFYEKKHPVSEKKSTTVQK